MTAMLDLKKLKSTGDNVLQNFSKKTLRGAGVVLVADATCVRGNQEIRGALHSGAATRSMGAANTYMNGVTTLDVMELEDGKLKVPEGGMKPFTLVGVPSDPVLDPVVLPPDNKCVVTWIDDTAVASLVPGDAWKVEGEEAGEAILSMFMAANQSGSLPEIVKEIAIEVGPADGGRSWENQRSFRFYNDEWNATVSARVSAQGGLYNCAEQYAATPSGPIWRYVCEPPPENDRYTVSLSVSGVYPENANLVGPNSSVKTFGILDGGSILEGSSFTKTIDVPKGGEAFFDFAIVARVVNDNTQQQEFQASATVFRFYVMRP